MVEDAELEWYYRGLGNEKVLIGMGRELNAPATDGPNMDFLPKIRGATTYRAPRLANFELIGGTSGIRPITPDILPIIGPVQSVGGFVNCCGWGGEGIMHSPAGGVIVANQITGASTSFVDTRLFLASRFV